jgi:predicted extracellular nuclease
MDRFLLALTFPLLLVFAAKAQNRGDVRVMTYNTENLFDTDDNPQTADNDFTPNGRLRWTPEKYRRKLLNIYKVIAGVGGWQPPEIIGLVEIENRKVLNDLLTTTPLAKFNYGIVHYESPDPRGIDVALLFRSEKFKILYQEPIYINFIGHPERKTRNILFVKLLYKNIDTLCIFVNHWPSRLGGEIETEDLRFETASLLRQKVDLIFQSNPAAKIVIIGDFNDEPTDPSLTNHLKAQPVSSQLFTNKLYNLSYDLLKTSKIGTHYFSGHWSILDQVIVSGGLLNASKGLYAKSTDIHIFAVDFITQSDNKNLGIKPLPTYSGPKYMGGYSDHLPVYLDLNLKM